MVANGLQLVIGGKNAKAIGPGKVSVTEVAHTSGPTGGGLEHINFSLALPKGFYDPVLRRDQVVNLSFNGVPLGSAALTDIDRDNWTFVADGLFKRADHFSYSFATKLANTVALANGRGMGWNGTGNLPNVQSLSPTSEGTFENNMVSDVLNTYSAVNGLWWGLSPTNVPYVAPAPTASDWVLQPGTPAMPTSDDDYVTSFQLRYLDSSTGLEGSVSAGGGAPGPYGVREHFEDVTPLGPISQAVAQSYASAYYAANGPRITFTAGVQPGPFELRTVGGVPIEPWSAGLRVCGKQGRHYGVLTSDGARTFGQTLRWTAASTVWTPPDNQLKILPANLAKRTVVSLAATQDSFGPVVTLS